MDSLLQFRNVYRKDYGSRTPIIMIKNFFKALCLLLRQCPAVGTRNCARKARKRCLISNKWWRSPKSPTTTLWNARQNAHGPQFMITVMIQLTTTRAKTNHDFIIFISPTITKTFVLFLPHVIYKKVLYRGILYTYYDIYKLALIRGQTCYCMISCCAL